MGSWLSFGLAVLLDGAPMPHMVLRTFVLKAWGNQEAANVACRGRNMSEGFWS